MPQKINLKGNLAALLAEPTGNVRPISLVAGGGIEPPTYGL
jgi:hypothetical protein